MFTPTFFNSCAMYVQRLRTSLEVNLLSVPNKQSGNAGEMSFSGLTSIAYK